jgi:energy-coupling factor transporter ATP-binding protein EcfA2
MAWRIDNISIQNFKFFNDRFNLPVKGKNILLYGENGSGKSSIYWSLYTFYQACLKSKDEAQKYFKFGNNQNLRNLYCKSSDYSGIKITFKNEGTSLQFEDSSDIVSVTDSLHKEFMPLSMASSDFMNYKFLASIFDFSNSQENDIFDVLAKEVFPFLIFKDSLILDDGTDSLCRDADSWWKYLSEPRKHIPTRNKLPNGAIIQGSPEFHKYQDKLYKFNSNLRQELTLIFRDANNKLKDLFKENISLQFKYESATFNDRIGNTKSHDGILHEPKIVVTAKMTDVPAKDNFEITHPRSFFNEARLTCMALALRLAFLDARIVAGDDFAPIIFIDDLLISLDMGCRKFIIPLLLNYADSKQMFIFTHDRAFYNLTRAEISMIGKEADWNCLELYADDEAGFFKPVLIKKKSSIDSAKHKYRSLDLSGCANTIRSACEHELKRILPLNLILAKNNDGDNQANFQNLNSLIQQFGAFSKKIFDSNLSDFPNIVPNLSNDRKLVMNPYSHDDIETPFYRRELKQAILDVEELTKIEKDRLITDNEIGVKKFSMTVTNRDKITADFIFLERFERVTYKKVRYYEASKIYVTKVSDSSFIIDNTKCNVKKLFKEMCEHLHLSATSRPIFEDCVRTVTDNIFISEL